MVLCANSSVWCFEHDAAYRACSEFWVKEGKVTVFMGKSCINYILLCRRGFFVCSYDFLNVTVTKQLIFMCLSYVIQVDNWACRKLCCSSGFISFSVSCGLYMLNSNTLLFIFFKYKHEVSIIQPAKPIQVH